MAVPSMSDAVRAYWEAVGLSGEPPEVTEGGEFDAFVEVLDRTSASEEAFRLVDLAADPYPGLLLGDVTEPWALAWAAHLAELEAFGHPAEPDKLFFADSIPDARGRHRVYSHEDGVRGMVEFAGLEDALAWMAVRVLRARGKAELADLDAATDRHATLLDDPHEETTASGFFVFETLLDAPFVESWDAYSRGEWPVVDGPPLSFRLRRQGGWQRILSLYLVQRFLEKRIVDFPKSVKTTELGAAHRALLSHLLAFEEAMRSGTAPEPIVRLAKSGDAALAAKARAWIERHDQWRSTVEEVPQMIDEDELDAAPAPAKAKAPAKKKASTKSDAKPKKVAVVEADDEVPEAPEPVETPFMARLRALLAPALDSMIAEELVEIVPDKKPAILAEMLAAAADARSPQHLLKQLAGALVHSEHVEEVFASDEELQDVLRTRLAGS